MASPKVEIKGRVVKVGEIVTSASGFTRREVVIDTAAENDKYPNPLPVTFKKERCADAVALAVGDEASVDVFLNGRRWDGGEKGERFFLDLSAASAPVVKKTATVEAGGVHDWASFRAFGLAQGETEAQLVERGKAYGAKTGKKSADYVLADWTALTAEVVAAHGGASADAAGADAVNEELPF